MVSAAPDILQIMGTIDAIPAPRAAVNLSCQVDALLNNSQLLERILEQSEAEKMVKVDKGKLQSRISEIDGQIAKLIELYQISGIPMEEVAQRVRSLSEEKKTLAAQLEQPEEVPAKVLFLSALKDYQTGYQTGDTAQKRLLLSGLIRRILINGKYVNVEWRL